jgi:1-deoxy-D-xylulose-5-phosphate reductoisomerase
MKNLAILGSTGSIGRQALDVARKNPDKIKVLALSAHHNAQLLEQQARDFGVTQTVLAERDGVAAVEALAALPEVDIVLNALVGAAGLRASYTSLVAGKRLALANKESLVVGGDLIMPLATHETLLPVDSEHSAIYQCLVGERQSEIRRLWITASGGPFRGFTRDQLAGVTAEQALAHPTWSMGPKISIDSATLMNKGLECIEAHQLFAVDYDQITVVIQPQSCIHSMVEYADGSVKAHLGATDMRIPIQYAFSYPERWDTPTSPVDFTQQPNLAFLPPDLETFGCLRLALQAGRAKGTAPCVLNAANEVANAAFRQGRCGFLDIEAIVAAALAAHQPQKVQSLEQLEEVDRSVRIWANQMLNH